jgi:single-strand DNA-binding protein
VNLVVVGGALSRPAQTRMLPSGDVLVALEVTVRDGRSATETVPVVWAAAPEWVRRLDAGESLVVLGRVRRRWFRADGATASRTEVVAQRGAPGVRRHRVDAVLARAVDELAATRHDPSGTLAPSGLGGSPE